MFGSPRSSISPTFCSINKLLSSNSQGESNFSVINLSVPSESNTVSISSNICRFRIIFWSAKTLIVSPNILMLGLDVNEILISCALSFILSAYKIKWVSYYDPNLFVWFYSFAPYPEGWEENQTI